MALLGALAVLQYRWSGRVAAADVQRETEYLESAAALFASQIDAALAQGTIFLQEDVWAAYSAGRRVGHVPGLFAEVYLLETTQAGETEVRRLTGDGVLAPSPPPDWRDEPRCQMLLQDRPPVLTAPVYYIHSSSTMGDDETFILQRFRWRPDRCFLARIDETYLREELFPAAIRQSFGAAAMSEYDFAVASTAQPPELVYGQAVRADLEKRFGAAPSRLTRWQSELRDGPLRGGALIVEHRERIVGKGPGPPSLRPLDGIWELQVSRKGGPLAAAVEQRRRRELLFAFGVEGALAAALVFLAAGVRRLQRLADQRMQFVANVSHELRTPASAIAMLARNQADGLVTAPDQVREYGELIHQQSRRLSETVEQTLELAGIQSGRRRPARDLVALRPLVEEVVEARRAEIARGGFELELALDDDLPELPGDAGLLRTAVDNLVSNALKHAARGRWLRVSASHDAKANEIRIQVADRGPGVERDEREEIFQPFSRGREAMDAQIPGSGLGLSLVRSAAETHGGAVTLESDPGRGSVFTLHLPS